MKSHSNIAIEAFLLRYGHTGVERYIENLIRELNRIKSKNSYTVFLWGDCTLDFASELNNIKICKIPLRSRLMRIFFQHTIFPFLLKPFKKTLFTGYLGSLGYASKKTVLWVYDLIALKYPELVKKETGFYYRLLLPYFLQRVRFVLVPSKQVKQDVLPLCGKYNSVVVARLPIDSSFLQRSYNHSYSLPFGISNEFYLVVGYTEPKKNLNMICKVATILTDRNFVLVGFGTDKTAQNMHLKNIVGLGFIDQSILLQLYHMCKAVVFLSFAEGYGYPVAEAIAVKRPVVCFALPSLLEFDHPLVHCVQNQDAVSVAEKIVELDHFKFADENKIDFLPSWVEHIDTLEECFAV